MLGGVASSRPPTIRTTMPILDDGYRIDLENYSGPLDLLLYLVRRHEIDLNDIPIATLTDQYMAHLRRFEQLDVNTAGEFLVMAATLLEIKSAMLLPRETDEEEDEETPEEQQDPRYELVKQLLAYKRYKDAAADLGDRRDIWAGRFARPGMPGDGGAGAEEGDDDRFDVDLEDVDLSDLCHAFARILATIGSDGGHEVVYDDTPITLHAADIVDRLGREGSMTLQAIFVGRQSRSEMIGLFLAVLELVRQHRIAVEQTVPGDAIRLALRDPAEDPAAAGNDVAAVGQATGDGDAVLHPEDYEWPDDATRIQAEQRAERRRKRLANRDFQSDNDPILDVDGDGDDATIDGNGSDPPAK